MLNESQGLCIRSRRGFLTRLALLACGCGLCSTPYAAPQKIRLNGGLCAQRVRVQPDVSITYDSTTGDSILDSQLALEAQRLSRTMEVQPALVIQVDSDSNNALAWEGKVLEGTSGTVFLGVQLVRRELEMNRRGWGGLVVAGILAHEFAHIYQYQHQLQVQLESQQGAVVLTELHADLLAGWYLGTKRRDGAKMDFGAFADGIYWLGDAAVNHPSHHGTEDQRRAAAIEGFRRGFAGEGPIATVAKAAIPIVHNVVRTKP